MNKTTDGRIIEDRVIIDKEVLKEIVFNIKNNHNLTWRSFASKLEVVPQTISQDWIKKGNTIPLSIFKKILEMDNKNFSDYEDNIEITNPFWGQKLKEGALKFKKISIPNVKSKEFAEFYGVLLGDGCINSDYKAFSIVAHQILEYNYFNLYLSNLIESLFGSKPKIVYDRNTKAMRLFFYSKRACEFMASQGFPVGLKYNKEIKLPDFILSNKINIAYFIRGIMDTDGSLSNHPHSKIMIHLSITIPSLRNVVKYSLGNLGIEAGEFNKGLMIYGENKIDRFYNTIGFSNYKNIYKYEQFKRTGKVPKSKEVETFLMDENRKLIMAL